MRIVPWRFNVSILLLAFLAAGLLPACGDSDRDETVPELEILSIHSQEDDQFADPDPEQVASPTLVEQIVLSGIAEPGATVEVTQDTATIDNQEIALVPSLPAGEWKTEAITLEPGTNLINVTATDNAGNLRIIQVTRVLADVIATAPAAVGGNVIADFREEVATEISNSHFQLKAGEEEIPAELTRESATRFVLDPVQGLSPETEYTIVISPEDATIVTISGREVAETKKTFTIPAQSPQ